jgi:hypothetical protein
VAAWLVRFDGVGIAMVQQVAFVGSIVWIGLAVLRRNRCRKARRDARD